MSTKPILFNTDMVRAILDGRKTVTRRAVKPQPECAHSVLDCDEEKRTFDLLCGNGGFGGVFMDWAETVKAPFWPHDILYVRETFTKYQTVSIEDLKDDIRLLSDCSFEAVEAWDDKWHPSIHMPREAARIFLRVTDVRVERLQDITDEQALREGVPEDTDYPLDSQIFCPVCKGVGLVGALHPVSLGYMEVDCPHCDTPTKRFANFWNSTLKPTNRAIYGWDANPWVWVIEFERCEMLKGD